MIVKDCDWDCNTCNCEACNKAFQIDKNLHSKKRLCKKRMFAKLVLTCKYETETIFNDKKLT